MVDVQLTIPELDSIITVLGENKLESTLEFEDQVSGLKSKLKEIYEKILKEKEEKRKLIFPDFNNIDRGTMVVRTPLLKNSSWASYKSHDYLNGRGLIIDFKYYYQGITKQCKEVKKYTMFGALCLPVVHWEFDSISRVMNPLFVELENGPEIKKAAFKFTKQEEDFLSELH